MKPGDLFRLSCGFLVLALLLGTFLVWAGESDLPEAPRERYTKSEFYIPMRDGVRLFTSVYSPKEPEGTYPIMLLRTPYGVHPYGENRFPSRLGPSDLFAGEDFIFAYQDVRGRYLSEGQFVNMRPHRAQKETPLDVDESTDTYDTIDWLLENVPNHNGRVGIWGISYPGFYAAVGMIDAHPALRAVSPQAPIADWFFDDFHHHGAFFLPHAFDFLAIFGPPRPQPTTEKNPRYNYPTKDGYQFYLDLGPLNEVNQRYLGGQVSFWDDLVNHPNYDDFWKSRNILPHLRNVAPAVMTVGGWFDAEDLYGPLQTYRAVEAANPASFNILVMGPWSHGGWARGKGDSLGDISFGSETAVFFRENIELPFFKYFLKGEGSFGLPEAYMFETGADRWRTFATWPPAEATQRTLYLHEGQRLSFEPSDAVSEQWDEYVSDPAKPVPFTEAISVKMTREYMVDDQRFASRRPDVLTYETEVLQEDLTLAGPVRAQLWVSTSGTDSDFIIKLIDVFPGDAEDFETTSPRRHMSGYQMLVRSEVIRGRFRNSYEQPTPFVPDQPTLVTLELQDVLHTFRPGHRVMIQIQSTWFPLVDRNPQQFIENVFEAGPGDYVKATQRVHRSMTHPSVIRLQSLP